MSVETIKVIDYVIIAVIFFIGSIIVAGLAKYLVPIFLGSFPFLRAKRLTEKDIAVLKEQGVCHKTTDKGLQGIQKEKTIKGSSGWGAYSTHRKKAAFFFANAYIERGENFNKKQKHRHIVKITNLTDKQIENMRIRSYDSAIASLGDFKFDKENNVEYSDMGRNYDLGEKSVIIFDKHTVAYIAAIILSIIASIIVAIIVTVIVAVIVVAIVARLLGIGISIPKIVGVIHLVRIIFGIA